MRVRRLLLVVIVGGVVAGCASSAASRTSESAKPAAKGCAAAPEAIAAAIRLLHSNGWESQYREANARAMDFGEEWMIWIPTVADQMPGHGTVSVDKGTCSAEWHMGK